MLRTSHLIAATKLVVSATYALSVSDAGAAEAIPLTVQDFAPSGAFSIVGAFLGVAIIGAVVGMCVVGAVSDRRARAQIRKQNAQFDAAINNMSHGLCLFDADNRLLLWNERYRAMYHIDPQKIWAGCAIRDLLTARIEAGTFPLDPREYETELRASLKAGDTLAVNVPLHDGRVITVTNQPIEAGGWVATHEDITERMRANEELRRTRAFLDTIISNIPLPVLVKDLPGFRYLLANRAAERFFGKTSAQLMGKTSHEVFSNEIASAIRERDEEMLRTGREVFYDGHPFTMPDGEKRIVTSTRLPVMGSDGKPQYLIAVIHDITQSRRDQERISFMAHNDPLTELPNRATFTACLKRVLEIASSSNQRFAVLCIDVDGFKGINDVFGHAAGDELLRQLAKRLESAAQGAFLARVDGDEFVVISPTGPQPETAEALAHALAASVKTDFDVDNKAIGIGITIGVALYPDDGATTEALTANADAALDRAKAKARGSIRFFEPAMDQELREKRSLQQDLRRAFAQDELELYYQPQAQIDGEVIGFEALARWHHRRLGMVPPSTFIPLAEDSNLIVPLGEWVLRAACREAALWPKPLRIAVNLSPVQFRHGDLANMVHAILLETGLSADRLELEITEGVLIGDFSRAVSMLRRLKNLGVRIAMDDFGTGYSSLFYLQSFPFDKIKIDKSFVANLSRSPQSMAIIRAVVGLGQGLGLPVMAEGVETREQLNFLASVQCGGVQGYLIGPPKPISDYAELVGYRGTRPALVAVNSRITSRR